MSRQRVLRVNSGTIPNGAGSVFIDVPLIGAYRQILIKGDLEFNIISTGPRDAMLDWFPRVILRGVSGTRTSVGNIISAKGKNLAVLMQTLSQVQGFTNASLPDFGTTGRHTGNFSIPLSFEALGTFARGDMLLNATEMQSLRFELVFPEWKGMTGVDGTRSGNITLIASYYDDAASTSRRYPYLMLNEISVDASVQNNRFQQDLRRGLLSRGLFINQRYANQGDMQNVSMPIGGISYVRQNINQDALFDLTWSELTLLNQFDSNTGVSFFDANQAFIDHAASGYLNDVITPAGVQDFNIQFGFTGINNAMVDILPYDIIPANM